MNMDFLSSAYAVDAARATAAAKHPAPPVSVPASFAPEEIPPSFPSGNEEETRSVGEEEGGAARGMTREEVARTSGKQKKALAGGDPASKRRKVTAQRQPGPSSKKAMIDEDKHKGKEKEKVPEGCKIRTSSVGQKQVVFPLGINYFSPDFMKHLSTLVLGSILDNDPYEGISSAHLMREVLGSLTHTMRGVLTLHELNKREHQKSN